MDTILSYRGNRPTHTPIHKHTHPATHPTTNKQTGPITIHCAAASAQCKKSITLSNEQMKWLHRLTGRYNMLTRRIATANRSRVSISCHKIFNEGYSGVVVPVKHFLKIANAKFGCRLSYRVGVSVGRPKNSEDAGVQPFGRGRG